MAFGNSTVGDWVHKILHPHQRIGIPLQDQHLFQLFTVNAIDLLWSCRSRVVHDGKRWEVDELAIMVRKPGLEHHSAWIRKLVPLGQQKWQSPPEHVMKINVDVAIRAEFAVVAAIIRDSKGQLCSFKTAKIGAVEPVVG